ncbi:MAG: NAD(P)-dependent oxidoreductase [Candidatus Omnitrophica bacterium]|nr:NAD(P)-dependent oxidoreductase [Candidatus Omnitrophota bacterium]MDE2223109.1 NAD(P)-dependent oxidoreductase [Candidatus Omnitrophota bacterium]
MQILFTGASSFTGYWFVRELCRGGHEVTATFTKGPGSYTGLRKRRIDLMPSEVSPVFSCSFGSPAFMELLRSRDRWDVLCHHATDTTRYKEADFDYVRAIAQNTNHIDDVLKELAMRQCSKVILTGSVFEPGEGQGDPVLEAFSPYGVGKRSTADLFGYFARRHGLSFGKFVIPNPFGPLEEERFTCYLMRSWLKGETAVVKTPAYVRDNIHVSALALAYSDFVGQGSSGRYARFNPSGYVESQKDFTLRVSREIAQRWKTPCPVEFLEQKDFSEPLQRYNTDAVYERVSGWDEARAWDEMSDYYRGMK